MREYELKMLSPDEVRQHWESIKPLVETSFLSNEVYADTTHPDDILALALTDQCAVFAGIKAGRIECVLVIQFNTQSGRKCADILSLAGEDLMQFKMRFWDLILDWLRANEVEYIDAHANERMAKIYKRKYGFDKSCAVVRMSL